MDKQYYKDYYRYEREHWWFCARRHILQSYIAKNIAGNKNLQILNIGAATGASSEMLAEFGTVTSTEYDADCINFVKDKLDFPIQQADITKLQFSDESYDVVCAFDVIEHVENDPLAVNELVRVCKPGGHIVVTVPAFMSLWSEHDVINHHFRRYEETEMEQLFSKQPVTKIFTSYFNARLYPLIATVRRLSGLKPKKDKTELRSDFEKFNPGLVNNFFYNIMAGEARYLQQQNSYKKGVSILAHYRKK
jgi:2-polyprenyl-3-methyl-5-hydroxy-6-metoxy-1,4-benzoquinol methylase